MLPNFGFRINLKTAVELGQASKSIHSVEFSTAPQFAFLVTSHYRKVTCKHGRASAFGGFNGRF